MRCLLQTVWLPLLPCLAVLSSSASHAADAVDAVDGQETIRVVVVGDPSDLDAVKDAVATWRLGARPLLWQSTRRFDPRAVLEPTGSEGEVRCWIDLSDSTNIRLYFANGRTQRYLVRSLDSSGNLDELDREALGQAVELSLLALLEDRAAGLSREDTQTLLAPPPEPKPEPEPRVVPPPAQSPGRQDEAHWELGAHYSLAPWLEQRPPSHGPGVSLARTFEGANAFASWARLGAHWPNTRDSEFVRLRAQASSLRLGAAWRPRLATWATGSQRGVVELGGGADLVRFEPTLGEATAGVSLLEGGRRVDWVVGAGLSSLTTFANRFSFRLGLWLDLAPNAVRYEIDVDGETRTAFRTRMVRPGAFAGVSVVVD